MPFAVTIFLGAFLLFQVQPVIARYILPWYGGSTGVWTACILFFQVGLVIGYSYAFLLRRFLDARKQLAVHLFFLLLTLLFLPITPSDALKPSGPDNPLAGIFLLLLSTVGAPYVVISATGPLLQHWYHLRYRDRSPYRLYALSNAGSLLGLVSYPFLMEPALRLKNQTLLWSSAYVLFFLVCSYCAIALLRYKSEEPLRAGSAEQPSQRIGFVNPLLWLAWSACGSVLLLATTNKITQDIAVIPFLWVVPLALYLITFIIAFDSPRWYKRSIWLPAFFISLPLVATLLAQEHLAEGWAALPMVVAYAGTMFVACMVCHGEMTRIKPDPGQLTFFYLMVALGGAMGGLFVSLIAPLIFNGLWEFHLIWVLVMVLFGIAVFRNPERSRRASLGWVLAGGWVGAAVLLSNSLLENIQLHQEAALEERRNFYGVLRAYGFQAGSAGENRELFHGNVSHGLQLMHPKARSWPTGYYGRRSGIGYAFEQHPRRKPGADGGNPEQGLRVGVIGLGVGTLASYARPADYFRMYEINPDVEALARRYFTFLGDSLASIDVVHGDGRISLEVELNNNGSQQFDVLVVDAFSGDAIPVHLLTVEAFELYWQHLKADGILAVHITNHYINLRPVLKALGKHLGKPVYYLSKQEGAASYEHESEWMLLTSHPGFRDAAGKQRFSWQPPGDPEDILWTDDYSSIFPLIKG